MKHQSMKQRWLIPALLLLMAGQANSQTLLNQYIRQGLDSNLALHQKSFDLTKAKVDLQRARTFFYPQANFNSQYTLATGGRSQELPIGDLLNDAYTSLNQLTGTNKFPQVNNQTIEFLPNNFQDTRVEITYPVLNTERRYNLAIKKELINTQQADIEVYKRELVKDIKEAYYRYLQAGKAVEIYTNALGLVNENLRVSEKRVAQDVATREIVLRAKAQVSQVQASLIEAQNNRVNAAAYFNFLLNQPLTEPVSTDSALLDQLNTNITTGLEVPVKREELTKLKSAEKVLNTSLQMNKQYYMPKLNAFYNIGFQGYGFKFNGDQFYQLGGLQLQWPLFRANDNKYKIRQAQTDIDAIANQYKAVEQQLSLQVQTTYNDYRSAVQTLQAITDEVQSTQETYRFTERRFREGTALQIELIDARTQLTNAQLKYSLAQLSVLTKAAILERVTASYTF